jgi:hypothetical protein
LPCCLRRAIGLPDELRHPGKKPASCCVLIDDGPVVYMEIVHDKQSALTHPELARRIVLEAEAVQTCFPGRFRLLREGDGQLACYGTVPVEGRDFTAFVRYPAAYPVVPSTLETSRLLPPGCSHVLERGPRGSRLCWIAPQG